MVCRLRLPIPYGKVGRSRPPTVWRIKPRWHKAEMLRRLDRAAIRDEIGWLI